MLYKTLVKYGIFLKLVCYNPNNNGEMYYSCAIGINLNIFNITFQYFYFKSWDVFSLEFWWAIDFIQSDKELEWTLKIIQSQNPCHGQGYFLLDHITQGLLQVLNTARVEAILHHNKRHQKANYIIWKIID